MQLPKKANPMLVCIYAFHAALDFCFYTNFLGKKKCAAVKLAVGIRVGLTKAREWLGSGRFTVEEAILPRGK